MKLTVKIFFIAVLCFNSAIAQVEKDSLNYSTQNFNDRRFMDSFDKLINTYNLNMLLKYNLTMNKMFIGFKGNFISNVTKTATVNIKDEQYFTVLGQYSFLDYLKFGLLFNNNDYTDDRQLAINKASLMQTTVYANFQPQNNVQIIPFGGISQNKQVGEMDKGYIYGAETSIDRLNFTDFELTSMLKFQNEDISPRKNTYRLASFNISNSIEENFTNTLSANYSEQRKDFYLIADPATAAEFNISNNIQSRLETSYFIQDKLRYFPINSPFSLDLKGRISWRDIDRNTRFITFSNVANTNYDTKIQEFKIDLSSAADYITEKFNLAFRLSYSERDEKNLPKRSDAINDLIFNERQSIEEQKNNNSALTNIAILSGFNFSQSDRLTFSVFHRKLKYDTPSDLNYDDRDELLSIARIMYEKTFNPYFKVFVNLEGSLNKIVYIFAERSSNNNLKRILKFSSGGTFSTGSLTSANSAEVTANYTVFDYEELNPNFQSYSFRQFVFRDSTNYAFNKSLRLFFTGYVKLSEQGDFKWSNFTSKPLRYLDERYMEPKIFYDFNALSLGLGIRYFSLSTFNFSSGTDKNLLSDYTSIGPLTEISYRVSSRINFKLYGWYEFIQAEDSTRREMANLSIKLDYRF